MFSMSINNYWTLSSQCLLAQAPLTPTKETRSSACHHKQDTLPRLSLPGYRTNVPGCCAFPLAIVYQPRNINPFKWASIRSRLRRPWQVRWQQSKGVFLRALLWGQRGTCIIAVLWAASAWLSWYLAWSKYHSQRFWFVSPARFVACNSKAEYDLVGS